MDDLMIECYKIATLSPDKSNQNGAIIVNKGRSVSSYNHIPNKSGEELSKILSNRKKKLEYILHAEEAVLVKAARSGMSTYGATMICPWASCFKCARMIIFSGIIKLIIHKGRMDATPERWKNEVLNALKWINNSGIKIIEHKSTISSAPKIIVNGELWQP